MRVSPKCGRRDLALGNRVRKDRNNDSSQPIEQVWFGYHKQHGWIVMDRLLKANAGHSTVKLVVAKDWSRLELPKREWHRSCDYCESAIARAPEGDRDRMRESFERVRQEFWERRMSLIESWEDEVRRRSGLPTTRNDDRPTSRAGREVGRNEVSCWKCGGALGGGFVTLQCGRCGWLLCPCGGCGCGWHQYARD